MSTENDTRDYVYAKVNGEEKAIGRAGENNAVELYEEFKGYQGGLVDVHIRKFESPDFDAPVGEAPGLTIEVPIETPATRAEAKENKS